MKAILSLLLLMSLGGCTGAPARVASDGSLNPSPEVFKKWHEEGNYYALLEIVDAYIDPFNFNHKATKADMLKYLGQKCDSEYPNAGPKMWVFPSSRRVPYGSYLVVYFDDHDNVKQIEWVSE